MYASSKFAVEGFSDSLRKELRNLGVAVVLVDPAVVVTNIQEKITQGVQTLDRSDTWVGLYGRYLVGIEAKVARATAMGDTTAVTDAAIVDAITNPRPPARYFVANYGGIPATVLAVITRVLPTYLLDTILESMS